MNNIFANYKKTREHYFSNAQETIQKKEFRKASELLWGVITQSIKSLASLNNIRIVKHSDFNRFLKSISKDIGDEKIYSLFLVLQSLHRNFYDEIILEEDFPDYYKKTLEFLEIIDDLIKRKVS